MAASDRCPIYDHSHVLRLISNKYNVPRIEIDYSLCIKLEMAGSFNVLNQGFFQCCLVNTVNRDCFDIKRLK